MNMKCKTQIISKIIFHKQSLKALKSSNLIRKKLNNHVRMQQKKAGIFPPFFVLKYFLLVTRNSLLVTELSGALISAAHINHYIICKCGKSRKCCYNICHCCP